MTTPLLTIGISTRALFDLEEENAIFECSGVDAYAAHQRAREDETLRPGTAFPLVERLLRLEHPQHGPLVEVVLMSRNTPDLGLRVFNAIRHHGLNITRAAFTGGDAIAPFLSSYGVDLFLSKFFGDVDDAVAAGFAAALLYPAPGGFQAQEQIRFAFDGDCVLFSDEAQAIYDRHGLAAFHEHEQRNAAVPLREGPFAPFLRKLARLQALTKGDDGLSPLRIGIVTARSAPAHERVIRTLRSWGITVNEAHFLGGRDKAAVLKAMGALIFFDDQETNLLPAASLVPSGRVPLAPPRSLMPVGEGAPVGAAPAQDVLSPPA